MTNTDPMERTTRIFAEDLRPGYVLLDDNYGAGLIHHTDIYQLDRYDLVDVHLTMSNGRDTELTFMVGDIVEVEA